MNEYTSTCSIIPRKEKQTSSIYIEKEKKGISIFRLHLQFTMGFQALPGYDGLDISMRLARCDVYIIFEFAADWVARHKMKIGEIKVDA